MIREFAKQVTGYSSGSGYANLGSVDHRQTHGNSTVLQATYRLSPEQRVMQLRVYILLKMAEFKLNGS